MKSLFAIFSLVVCSSVFAQMIKYDDIATKTEVYDLIKGKTIIADVTKEYRHDLTVDGVTLNSGEIFAGLAIAETNLTGIVPVIGVTPAIKLYAPYAQGYYTTGLFSAIEIGNYYQMLFTQRMMLGSGAYFPNPSSIRFYDNLTTNALDKCITLQDYLNAGKPETIAGLLKGYIPCEGDSAINGSLRVTGTLSADGNLNVTNSNILAKNFSVVDGNVTAVGMTISSGHCNLQSANVERELSSQRFHIAADVSGGNVPFALTNFTFGGTYKEPKNNLYDYINEKIEKSASMNVTAQWDDWISEHEGELKSYPIRLQEMSRIYYPKRYECNVLNETTFPKSTKNEIILDPASDKPLDFKLVIAYSSNVPTFEIDSARFWRIVSDRPDAFSDFRPGVISILEFKQISSEAISVVRRDMQEIQR